MENIQFKTEFVDKDIPVISVKMSGYIDQANCDQLQNVFDNLFSSQHYKLIFEMGELTYMSSAGWGIFVGEVKRFRDRGGDIKLAEMKPEVYEIFQMLEFYHILDDYYSAEEALEIYHSGSQKRKAVESPGDSSMVGGERPLLAKEGMLPNAPTTKVNPNEIGGSFKSDVESDLSDIVNFTQMPLPDKVRKIISMHPLISFRNLRKLLLHDDFGNVKIGYFKLYRVLRRLNLDTKIKRYRYYRSC